MKKTVVFLCGLIGAGKTTYAINNFKVFTDLDLMRDKQFGVKKIDQIKLTKELLKDNDEVCHITCFPSKSEIDSFREYVIKYLWVDTNPLEAQRNVISRNRKRDMSRLDEIFKANKDYAWKKKTSNIVFKEIKTKN